MSPATFPETLAILRGVLDCGSSRRGGLSASVLWVLNHRRRAFLLAWTQAMLAAVRAVPASWRHASAIFPQRLVIKRPAPAVNASDAPGNAVNNAWRDAAGCAVRISDIGCSDDAAEALGTILREVCPLLGNVITRKSCLVYATETPVIAWAFAPWNSRHL